MSEFNSTEKMGNEHLASRPLGGSSAASGTGRHYPSEAPRVLARMPDLGPGDSEREGELPALERDGRLLSSRVSVAVLMGGVAVLLLVALVPFLLFNQDKEDPKQDTASWQQPPAPDASEAPPWGGASNDASTYPSVNGVPPYQSSGTSPSAAWNSPSAGWNPEVASRRTPPAWSNEGQGSTPNAWGSSNEPMPHSQAPQAHSWNTPSQAPGASEPSYGWNQQPSVEPMTQDNASAWNAQNRASSTDSWSNPSYDATAQPYGNRSPAEEPQDTSWSSPMQQAAAVDSQPSYASPETTRPVGPMMPSSPASFSADYEASRPAPSYRNQYQAQADVNRAGVANGQNDGYGQADPSAYRNETSPVQPTSGQPHSYGTESYNNQSYNNQSYNNQPYNGQSYNGQSYNNQSYNNQSYNGQSYNNQPYNGQSYNNQPSQQPSTPGVFQGNNGTPSQPASPYGSNPPYGYNQGTNYSAPSNYPSSAQAGASANYPTTYPAAGASNYPNTDYSNGTAAPADATGSAPYAEPGVARFQGVIEKPTVRTSYDRTRPSVY